MDCYATMLLILIALALVLLFHLLHLRLFRDWQYRSEAWLSVDNRGVLTQDGFSVFNALATWQSRSQTWRASAGIRNLTDEVYKSDALEFSRVGNIQTAYYGDPRTWQLTVGYSF